MAIDTRTIETRLPRPRNALGELADADGFEPGADRETHLARVDDEAAGGLQVLAGEVEALLRLRREAAFDLDRPALSFGQVKYEVNFGSVSRPVEARLRPLGRDREQVLEDEALGPPPPIRTKKATAPGLS